MAAYSDPTRLEMRRATGHGPGGAVVRGPRGGLSPRRYMPPPHERIYRSSDKPPYNGPPPPPQAPWASAPYYVPRTRYRDDRDIYMDRGAYSHANEAIAWEPPPPHPDDVWERRPMYHSHGGGAPKTPRYFDYDEGPYHIAPYSHCAAAEPHERWVRLTPPPVHRRDYARAAPMIVHHGSREDHGFRNAGATPRASFPGPVLVLFNLPRYDVEKELYDEIAWTAKPQKILSILDRRTGAHRGYAFVTFHSTEDATRAKDYLHGKEFLGRILRADYSNTSEPYQSTPGRYLGRISDGTRA